MTSSEDCKDSGRFVLVEVHGIFGKDSQFMEHKPTTLLEKGLQDFLENAWTHGVPSFYCQTMDPSFDINGGLTYRAGQLPGTNRAYEYWKEQSKLFCPERGSRLGTLEEYRLFSGLLIKELVMNGWTVDEAWNAVCVDSKDIGHYCNSENAIIEFEVTGSRKVGRFSDLANTCKVLSDDGGRGFWTASGCFANNGKEFPIADVIYVTEPTEDTWISTGWIVLTK